MSEDSITLDKRVEPPDTKLTELLAAFQGFFNQYPSFQLIEPPDVVARVLGEPKNTDEVRRFIACYLNPHAPSPYALAEKGMAVMFMLGYMYAAGEQKMRSMVN